MIEKDTIRLLRECDAGVKMGVSSINDVIGHVRAPALKNTLTVSRDEHEKLGQEIRRELLAHGALGARLTGTGSVVYGLFDDLPAASRAALVLQDRFREVHVVRPLGR